MNHNGEKQQRAGQQVSHCSTMRVEIFEGKSEFMF